MIFMPPRHGKSLLSSDLFPTWFAGRNPDRKILFTTYGQSLASEFGRKVRNRMNDPLYKFIFPELMIDINSNASNRIDFLNGGSYFAVGAGGSITGRGTDILIMDDLIKGREAAESELQREKLWQWYVSVASTRLMPGARQLFISTRWHYDDLGSRLLNSEKDWTVLSLPAINEQNQALWPEAYSIEALEEKRKLNKRDFEALYQQRPVPNEGNLFKRSWWQRYRELPHVKHKIQTWDTATKVGLSNDFSVCATWGESDSGYYLIDIWKRKVEMPQLLDACQSLYLQHQPNAVLIEDKSSGMGLIQTLRQKTTMPIIAYDPKMRDKQIRASNITPIVEAQKCFLPFNEWVEDFIIEHELFPNTSHDDQVDTTSMALEYFKNRQAYKGPNIRRIY